MLSELTPAMPYLLRVSPFYAALVKPYSYATVDDCSRVAAHVHADTMPDAIKPGLTLREAVLNSSDVVVENLVYLFCNLVIPIIRKAKKKPTPTTTPYPAPTGSTVAPLDDMVREIEVVRSGK